MRTSTVVGVAIATALGGCGGGDDKQSPSTVSGEQRAILTTVDALETASRRGDAARICKRIFTPALARSIGRASKHGCKAEVRDTLTSPDARLSVQHKIDVHGSRATATIREANGDTSRVSFVKDAGRWRIERVTPVRSQ